MNISILSHGFTTDILVRLAESLLHFIWQGGVVAVIVLLADRWLHSHSAQLRYALHLAALLLMLACVPVTYVVLQYQHSQEIGVPTATSDNEFAASEVAVTRSNALDAERAEPGTLEVSGHRDADLAVLSLTPPVEQAWDQLQTIARFVAPYMAGAYLLGVALMFGRLGLALLGGHRLCSEARPVTEPDLLSMAARLARKIGLRAAPVVAWCGRTSVPLVAGLIKPMILLPVALASSLTPNQLEALLAHELAHLRRFDLLVNLVQRVAEAVLFFHPAVWYVSRRISSERENCCDDCVLRAGWGRVEYADALVRMAEICAPLRGIGGVNAAALLAAAGNNPSQFKRRILRLLGAQESLRLRGSRGAALAILGVVLAVVLAIPILFSAPSLVGQNEKSPVADTSANGDREPEILPGHYQVSFRETPWSEVLAWYARVTGDHIETKIVPAGNFNYESSRPLGHREISQLINSELLSRGYCLAEEGGGFSVQPSEVIARQYAERFRKDFMHGGELRKGPDKFESYFEIVSCRIAGRTNPPAPSGPAIAYVLKARRDFSPQEVTAFFGYCFADVSMPSLKTGQLILADGFAVLHNGKWLGKKAPALQKGEKIEIWQNYSQPWNARPPKDYRLVIEGRIVGPDGKPVASARVQQLLLEGAPDGPEGEELRGFLNWAFGGEAIVDKEGKFLVSLNQASQFVRQVYFHVSAPGFARQRVGPIAIDSAKPAAELKIELKPGFSGRLRLVLEGGKPLDKGEVELTVQDDLWAWSQPMAKLPVGGDPITVPNCPAGPLLLKVRVPGFLEQEIRDVVLVEDKVFEVQVAPKPLEAQPKEAFYFRGKEALKRIESVKPKWGESQHGIEFGLARLDDKRILHSDERVRLELFIRNTGKETVKVQLANEFLANVPEVKDERGEAVKVESIFLSGSVPLYQEILKPGEAFGFRHLGLGLGPRTWPPHWAEPKPGKYTLRHTHKIDVDPVDKSKPGKGAMFTTGAIEFEVAAPPTGKAPDAADPFAARIPPANPGFKPRSPDKSPPRDGVHRIFRPDGKQLSEQNYKDGQLHGPSLQFNSDGEVYVRENYKEGTLDGFKRRYEKGKVVGETFYRDGKPEGATFVRSDEFKMNGQYLNGKRAGTWTAERIGLWKWVRNYKDGLLDGPWEGKSADGKRVFRLTYDKGKLVGKGDELKAFPFLQKVSALVKNGRDSLADRTLATLETDVDLNYSQTPATEVVEDMRVRFGTPMYVDIQATDIAGIGEKPVSVNEKQIPLFLGLHEIATNHDLTFDYRFHALWLTTPKATAAWKDTTGVSALKPAKGSPLAMTLPEPPKFDLLATPISGLAEPLQKEHDVSLDASRVKDAEWHQHEHRHLPGVPQLSLQDALSITLYINKCHCREEGGKLIIEPLQMKP